jgi:hypothetical protein
MDAQKKKKPYRPPQVRSEKILVANLFGTGSGQGIGPPGFDGN